MSEEKVEIVRTALTALDHRDSRELSEGAAAPNSRNRSRRRRGRDHSDHHGQPGCSSPRPHSPGPDGACTSHQARGQSHHSQILLKRPPVFGRVGQIPATEALELRPVLTRVELDRSESRPTAGEGIARIRHGLSPPTAHPTLPQ